jgi:uroporphyrinogen-III synthase
MSRPIAVLRPEPGNRVTAAAIEARGRTAIRMPLFEVRPLAWQPPDPVRFDALLLTSANAVRHGGSGLARMLDLPVYAVGEATADAARRRGFDVTFVGSDGAAQLLTVAEARGVGRALHLAGRDRTVAAGGIVAEIIAVYASEPSAVSRIERLQGAVAMVQSTRAGARLAQLVDDAGLARGGIALAVVSDTAAAAAGDGWKRVLVAPGPAAEAILAAAITLAD